MTDMSTSATVDSPRGFDHINKPLFLITGGSILLFCLMALVNLDALSVMAARTGGSEGG